MLGLRNLFLAVICVIMGKNFLSFIVEKNPAKRFF